MRFTNHNARPLWCVVLSSLLIASPICFSASFNAAPQLHLAYAFGKDDSGNSGSGSSNSGSGSSNSGSGSSNSGSGSSGSGSSGSGSGGSGSSGSGSGGSDNDESDDDNGYQKKAGANGKIFIRAVEVTDWGVEIHYSDRSIEKISSGRYEKTNASGGTVDERQATGADISRLRGLAQRVSIKSVHRHKASRPRTVEVQTNGDNIEIRYSNGWREKINSGQYELKDPYNRKIADRPATGDDWKRLKKAANR